MDKSRETYSNIGEEQTLRNKYKFVKFYNKSLQYKEITHNYFNIKSY